MACAYSDDNGGCQFQPAETLVGPYGMGYCPWHLPAATKSYWPPEKTRSFTAEFYRNVEGAIAHNREINFRGVVFPGAVELKKKTLHGANFDSAVFCGDADFESSTFTRTASFSDAIFANLASFSGAKFSSLAIFQGAFFQHSANFQRCEFGDWANFAYVRIDDVTDFRNAKFAASTDFRSPRLPEHSQFWFALFSDTTFADEVDFVNRVFLTGADFEGAKFFVAPKFHGCTFHEATIFPNESAFLDRSDKRAPAAYRTLRLAMEKQSSRREAGMFYALEQASLRNASEELAKHQWLMSWLYEKVSDYGRNAIRPLVWLLAVTILFAWIYGLYGGEPFRVSSKVDWQRVGQAATFSLEQIVQPGGVWREMTRDLFDGRIDVPSLIRWVCTLQSIVSVALISLSLLAIRWQFKRE